MHLDQKRRSVVAMAGLAAAGVSVAGFSALAPRAARAQAWPARPIRILCGFPPGGLTDGYARAYGEFLSQKLNQSVVVDNRPGAGGFIALEALSRSAPDGYTLGVTTQGSVWASRALYRKVPFDADRDFAPISLFPSGALLMGINPALPVRNLREWIDYARANKAAIGSYAPASIPHIFAEELNRSHGGQLQTIHYKGESPMWVDVASGTVQAAIGSYQAIAPYLARNALRPIAATGRSRCPKLPDVPTFVEAGFDAACTRLDGWLPMLAPAAVPADVLKRISEIVLEASDSPRAKALYDTYAIPTRPTPMDEAQRRWKEESVLWVKMAEQMNIKLD